MTRYVQVAVGAVVGLLATLVVGAGVLRAQQPATPGPSTQGQMHEMMDECAGMMGMGMTDGHDGGAMPVHMHRMMGR